MGNKQDGKNKFTTIKDLKQTSINLNTFIQRSAQKTEDVHCNLIVHHKHPTKTKVTRGARKSSMWPVGIRHRSHHFATQSSHFVDRAGWQAKMASIEFWIPWRNAHGLHPIPRLIRDKFTRYDTWQKDIKKSKFLLGIDIKFQKSRIRKYVTSSETCCVCVSLSLSQGSILQSNLSLRPPGKSDHLKIADTQFQSLQFADSNVRTAFLKMRPPENCELRTPKVGPKRRFNLRKATTFVKFSEKPFFLFV